MVLRFYMAIPGAFLQRRGLHIKKEGKIGERIFVKTTTHRKYYDFSQFSSICCVLSNLISTTFLHFLHFMKTAQQEAVDGSYFTSFCSQFGQQNHCIITSLLCYICNSQFRSAARHTLYLSETSSDTRRQ